MNENTVPEDKNAADRDLDLWRNARTLEDLTELTAMRAEGKISRPAGTCIPDPVLLPIVAALGRAGYMATDYQVSSIGSTFGGVIRHQVAAVTGFCPQRVMQLLSNIAYWNGLTVIAHDPAALPRWFSRRLCAVPVAWRNFRTVNRYGQQLSRRHLTGPCVGYGLIAPVAQEALCSAWQVTLIGKVNGPDLWRALAVEFGMEPPA